MSTINAHNSAQPSETHATSQLQIALSADSVSNYSFILVAAKIKQ